MGFEKRAADVTGGDSGLGVAFRYRCFDSVTGLGLGNLPYADGLSVP